MFEGKLINKAKQSLINKARPLKNVKSFEVVIPHDFAFAFK